MKRNVLAWNATAVTVLVTLAAAGGARAQCNVYECCYELFAPEDEGSSPPLPCVPSGERWNCTDNGESGRKCDDGVIVGTVTCTDFQPIVGCCDPTDCVSEEATCEYDPSIASECNDDVPDCDREICDNNLDDDCDGSVDEIDAGAGDGCTGEIPCNGIDDNDNGKTDEPGGVEQCRKCGGVDGEPVDLWRREMSVEPRTIASIESGISPSHDLTLALSYESARAKLDFADDILTGSPTQWPYARTLGPGMRHSFSDRLVLHAYLPSDLPASPSTVDWDSPRGLVSLYRTTPTSSTYVSEPGVNVRLVRSGSTWKLYDENGDVRIFKDGTSNTVLHPWTSTGAYYHARLVAVHPQGALNFRFAVQYEGDESLSGADQMPSLACEGVVVGASTCTPSRGLLVRIAAQFLGATPKWSNALELQYEVIASGGSDLSKAQYLLRHVRAGTNRDDGASTGSLQVLAHVKYERGATLRPYRLIEILDGVACTDTATAAMCRRSAFTYESTTRPYWAVSDVKRSIQNESGVAALGLEETFDWGRATCTVSDDCEPLGIPTCTSGICGLATDETAWFVSTHASSGVTLSTTTRPFAGAMNWTRNKQLQATEFNSLGNPTKCASGLCGDPAAEQDWHQSNDNANTDPSTSGAVYTLGRSHWRTRDGIDVFEDHNAWGQTTFRCEVVATVGQTPTCYLNPDVTLGDRSYVSVGNGALRRAVVTYTSSASYPSNPVPRIAAVVEYVHNSNVPSQTPTFPTFANTATNWSTTANHALDGTFTCASRTTAWGTHLYDVTIFDRDSDGDLVLNEAYSSTQMPDAHVVRTWHAAGYINASGSIAATQTCDMTPVDEFLRPQATRRYFNGAQTAQTDRTYVSTSSTTTRIRGRLQTLERRPDVSSTTITIKDFSLCSPLGNSIDSEGRVICQYFGANDLWLVEWTSFPSSPWPSARKRTLSLQDNTSELFATYTITSASGTLLESGVDAGNYERHRYAASNPAAGLARAEVRDVNSADNSIRRVITAFSTGSVEPAGTALTQTTTNGTSTEALRTWSGYDQDGWPAEVVDDVDATSTDAVTSMTYTEWGAPDHIVEPDQQAAGTYVFHTYGTDVTGAGRQVQMGRTIDSFGTQRILSQYVYNRRGDLLEVQGTTTGVVQAQYVYDGMRQMIKETMPGAGIKRTYTYDDVGIPAQIVTSDATGGSSSRTVYLLHDDVGRLLSRCGSVLCTTGGKQIFRYDTKGSSFLGTWGAITISDDHQNGRLAYMEDDNGATFFEYDAAGRTIAVIRHDGALSSFNSANLTQTKYTFSSGSPGTLDMITYPSGRRVKYLYGDDKRRPQTVQVEVSAGSGTYTTIAGNIAYHTSGAPKTWTWGSGSGTGRVISRDLLGRITAIADTVNGSLRSNQTYPIYELDGDLEREQETVAPTALVQSAATGNVTRNHDVEVTRNMLDTWQDDLATHDLSISSTFGRRSSEAVGAKTFTYCYSGGSCGGAVADERLISKTWSGGTDPAEAVLTYNGLGEVTAIDWSANGANDVSFTYTFLGAVGTETPTGGSAITSQYDAFMRRTRTSTSSNEWRRWRFGVEDEPLEEYSKTSALSWKSMDAVYLQGTAVGFVTNDNVIGHGPALSYAITDRAGVVRKTENTSGQTINRLVMDAWGNGVVVADLTTTAVPLLGWRNPGQYQDPTTGVSNNRWRSYVPGVGAYLSPDALHVDTQRQFAGAQAYVYGAARPFTNIDPDGRRPFNPKDRDDVAACEDRVESGARSDPDGETACDYARRNLSGWCGREQPDEPGNRRDGQWTCGCMDWYYVHHCLFSSTENCP